VHQGIVQYQHYRTTKLVAFQPLVIQERRPIEPHAQPLPKLAVELKPSVSPLVVKPQIRVAPERAASMPQPGAPEIKLESKKLVIPDVPTSPVVAVGTFSHESPVTAPVVKPADVLRAGTFGDANANPGVQSQGRGSVLESGAFGFAAGSGKGSGGRSGNGQVVTGSGFGNGAIDALPAALHPKTNPQPLSDVSSVPVEITFKPRPDYTDEGRKLGINGEVRLEVMFKSDGRVVVMRVLKGLGYGLDEQAVKAAQQIKFKPALREGQPIDSMAQVHIIFELIS
jgi:TonB family protein